MLAAKLHKALETYKTPKNLKLKNGKGLSPIFRDAAELTAHHSLSEKIQEAVQSSRLLIVLCSPAAKESHWVNEEIRLFRSLHGEGAILCVLAEGTPETSFPPALLEGGREPLAANLSGGRENFRLGATQLAASMLGVGLDELIQRDSKRRRNRLRALSGASLAFAAVMGGMAWTAIDARDAAEVSRTEAEKMVEFMLTDLKQDLEPVGKLDILDDVGKRVSDYYQAIPLSDMDDDRLARQARARHLLGQVALDQRKMEKAKIEIDAAYAATKEVLRKSPNDTDAIFAHAQSAYWVGAIFDRLGDVEKMKTPLSDYNNLAQKLYKSDPTNFNWVMEAAWGQNNLGLWAKNHYTKLKTQESTDYYTQAISYFREALAINPESKLAQYELSNSLAGRALAELAYGTAKQSRAYKFQQVDYLNQLIQQYPEDKKLLGQHIIAKHDYYSDYFVILSEAQEEEIIKNLDQLWELILFDPKNMIHKLWFLNFSFDYITKIDARPTPDLLSNVSNLVFQLPDTITDKEYYETMLKIVNLSQAAVSNDKQQFLQSIRNNDFDEHKKRRAFFLYYLQNKNADTAEAFLSVMKESPDIPYPTILNQQMRAHLELKSCSEANALSQILYSRGFIELNKHNFMECSVAN